MTTVTSSPRGERKWEIAMDATEFSEQINRLIEWLDMKPKTPEHRRIIDETARDLLRARQSYERWSTRPENVVKNGATN